MITREPKVGDKIEYNENASRFPDDKNWRPAGVVVAMIDSLCYSYDDQLPEGSHRKYFGRSPVPPGCETANSGFIWRFHDGLNKMHRIVE